MKAADKKKSRSVAMRPAAWKLLRELKDGRGLPSLNEALEAAVREAAERKKKDPDPT